MATTLAAATGRGWSSLWVAAAVGAGQLSVGWCNDAVDAVRDMVAGRRDKPTVRGLITPGQLRRAAVIAFALCVPLSMVSGLVPGLLHVTAVAVAWSYNLWLKSTAASVLPFAVSFALLPAYVVAGAPGAPAPPGWLLTAGALLGSGAHFVNVLPDLADDARTGVYGLPHRLGRRGSLVAGVAFLVGACAMLAFGPRGGMGTAGGGLLAVAAAGTAGIVATSRRTSSRAPFGLALVVAACAVALLVLRGDTFR